MERHADRSPALRSSSWIPALTIHLHPGAASGPDRTGRTDQASRAAAPEPEPDGLHDPREWMRLVLDSATDYAIVTLDPDGYITGWNAGAQRIVGYAEGEIVGRWGDVLFTPEDRALDTFTAELRRAREAGRARNERWHVRRNGTWFWASGMMMPMLGKDGRSHGYLNIMRDGTDRKEAADRQALLAAEMNHRIRNTLALVQAVAVQTRREVANLAEFEGAFGARLQVLARSSDMLMRTDWCETPLRDAIEAAVAAIGGDAGRIAMHGPPVRLAGGLVAPISLAVHELATNAVKHGALSLPAGRVEVSWQVRSSRTGPSTIEIVWRERGGPAVTPPRRTGFGTLLLRDAMPKGGIMDLDFRSEGLECRIVLPLGRAGDEAAVAWLA